MEKLIFGNGTIERGLTGPKNNTVRGSAVVYADGTDLTICQPYADGSYERIATGAFDSVVRGKHDVIATFEHIQQNLLARSKSNTLRLVPTNRSLDFELDLPDTQLGRDTAVLIERGDLQGCSFVADPGYSTISHEGGRRVVTVRAFKALHAISLSILPYYSGTNIQRGRDIWLTELENEYLRELKTKELAAYISSL